MKLARILWLSQLLPQPAADSLCLSTTVYTEARDQTLRGQQAVAEVALRRLDSGLWGDSMCQSSPRASSSHRPSSPRHPAGQ